jgi:hypothetical protein
MTDLIETVYQFRSEFESCDFSAVEFHRMRSPFYHGERWAVRRAGDCLTRDGTWEYEPMPSSRDAAFYARCRFDGLGQALATYNTAIRAPRVK